MSDHIEIYNELKRTHDDREREAETLGSELKQLDSNFREILSAWIARESDRISQFGHAENVILQLEEPGNAGAGSTMRDWQSALPAQAPDTNRLRYYIAYRPRLVPGLPLTYLIIFSYVLSDMGGALQLIRCVEDVQNKLGEMYPKVIGQSENGLPTYHAELNSRLSELLNIAAADYREQVLGQGNPLPVERQTAQISTSTPDNVLIGKEPRG